MGPQNRSLWKLLDVGAGRHGVINNYIPHPCLKYEKLLIVPDRVHIFKNIAAAFTKGHSFTLEKNIMQKYSLQHDVISIEPIILLYELN